MPMFTMPGLATGFLKRRGQFHRCFRCKRLQYVQAYEPTVNASVTFAGDFGDRELTLPNSVIKRYV